MHNTVQHDPLRVPVTLPTCPVCEATGHRCATPDGRFHEPREQLLAQACGCTPCKTWLTARAVTQPSLDDLFAYDGDLLTT